jgi:hypothetical protein
MKKTIVKWFDGFRQVFKSTDEIADRLQESAFISSGSNFKYRLDVMRRVWIADGLRVNPLTKRWFVRDLIRHGIIDVTEKKKKVGK